MSAATQARIVEAAWLRELRGARAPEGPPAGSFGVRWQAALAREQRAAGAQAPVAA